MGADTARNKNDVFVKSKTEYVRWNKRIKVNKFSSDRRREWAGRSEDERQEEGVWAFTCSVRCGRLLCCAGTGRRVTVGWIVWELSLHEEVLHKVKVSRSRPLLFPVVALKVIHRHLLWKGQTHGFGQLTWRQTWNVRLATLNMNCTTNSQYCTDYSTSVWCMIY